MMAAHRIDSEPPSLHAPVMLGEVIAANRGVGYLVEANAGQFNTTGVFAAVFVLVVCSLTLSEVLTRWESATTKGRSGM